MPILRRRSAVEDGGGRSAMLCHGAAFSARRRKSPSKPRVDARAIAAGEFGRPAQDQERSGSGRCHPGLRWRHYRLGGLWPPRWHRHVCPGAYCPPRVVGFAVEFNQASSECEGRHVTGDIDDFQGRPRLHPRTGARVQPGAEGHCRPPCELRAPEVWAGTNRIQRL